ncbi:chitin synthase-domain-containing protein [Thelonectria olida]|uniref:chitin synthase n=1 Tax=Thelonectria olida TaxID=1576542 RepID=A0A9P8W0T0_9HYPO|nr:chitin synthase-domain-containing protein [Thelonectria olida]
MTVSENPFDDSHKISGSFVDLELGEKPNNILHDDSPASDPNVVQVPNTPSPDSISPESEKIESEKVTSPNVSDQNQNGRGDTVETCGYPEVPDPVDPARVLNRKDLTDQRVKFLGGIVLLNILMTITAFFGKKSKIIFVMILFIKSKDFLSAIISPLGIFLTWLKRLIFKQEPVEQKWILSLIPAYSESEEQIVKTIFSLRDNGVEPHRQVMVVVLDGNPRDVKGHMTRVLTEFERPYISFKWKRGVLRIIAGFMEDVPVIVLEKVKNGGKKDSLILCHDLFNYSRDNAPLYTKLLREEIWASVLPPLTEGTNFAGFDMVFCTDADSTIYKGALAKLANALIRDKSAIAACGLVLVELEPGYEWSFWNLYQQFQYTFGQYVRRRAEHYMGKVTCLPGCITMIAVREEMGGAIRKYAEPITGYLVLSHQVQYLGTDRRLTYSMLSQGKHLRTLFVPDAVSETVAPQSITHYLSQRRRWGSNAYFNNYFYLGGEKMIPLTRIAATIEVVRLSLVYYRVLNTVLFIRGLVAHGVNVFDLLPMLIIGQLPSLWFFFSIMIEKELRMRAHKLFLGFCINKCISPFMSLIIFTKVATNLGSQAWGMSGVTATSAAAPATQEPSNDATDLSAAERGEAGHSTPELPDNQNHRERDPQHQRERDGSGSFSGVSIEC